MKQLVLVSDLASILNPVQTSFSSLNPKGFFKFRLNEAQRTWISVCKLPLAITISPYFIPGAMLHHFGPLVMLVSLATNLKLKAGVHLNKAASSLTIEIVVYT